MATEKRSLTLSEAIAMIKKAESENESVIRISPLAFQLVYDLSIRYVGGIQYLKLSSYGRLKGVNTLYWAEYILIYP